MPQPPELVRRPTLDERTFGSAAIVSRDAFARRRLSAAAEELANGEIAWLDIGGAGGRERAVAKDIARRAEESNAELVAMTADDARIAAGRLLAGGSAVLVVPPTWQPQAGFARVAVAYDGRGSADAAIEAARALAVARGGRLHVDVVHVDDSASAAADLDADVVRSRRAVAIEWWLGHIAQAIPAPGGVARYTGDPVAVLAEISSDVDLLVVGAHARCAPRLLVGRSVSERLIDAVRCPLLIVPRASSPGWMLAGTRRHQRHGPARRADQTDGHGSEQRRAERVAAARSGHEQRRGLLAPDCG